MYSHDDIWRAIDRLAQSFGYSPSGLAKKAGLDPTTFNKSKRLSADGKARWPSTESIAKILAVTGASLSDFYELSGQIGPATLRAGDRVAIMRKAGIITGVLIRHSADVFEVRPDKATETITLRTREIEWAARIVWTGDKT